MTIEHPDQGPAVSAAAIVGFMLLCLATIWWIFRSGYKLKA